MAQKDRDAGKIWERTVAKDLCTTRTGPTGFGDPDIVFTAIAIECKAQGKLSLKKKDLEQAETNAKGRKWSLLLKERYTNIRVAVIPYDQWLEYALWQQSKN